MMYVSERTECICSLQVPLRYDADSWEITLSEFDSSRLCNTYKVLFVSMLMLSYILSIILP